MFRSSRHSYLARGQLPNNKKWEDDIDAAISIFEDLVRSTYDHKCVIYNNISSAYRYKSRRAGEAFDGHLAKRAKATVLRAVELSTQESNIDVWATALHNLGGMLAEEAERCEGEASTFLRIQAIAAFVSSLEVCLESAFNLQLAETQLALGRVLLDHSRHANNRFQEVYLFRSIAASRISRAHLHEGSSLREVG